MSANQIPPRPVVHLELHTPDQVRASAFYAELLHWRPEVVRAAAGSYLALDTGGHLGGGIVECGTRRPLWLPYVEVDRVDGSTERARAARRASCCSNRAKGRRAGAASSRARKQARSRSGQPKR